MKRLLTILLTTSCPILLLAQAESSDTYRPSDKEAAPAVDEKHPQNNTDYSALRPKNLQPGVNRLPLDGTPCIVPDTERVVPMPNAWKGPLRIPFKKKKPVALYNESGSEPVLN